MTFQGGIIMKKTNLLSKVCLLVLIVLFTVFITLFLLGCSNGDDLVPVYTGPAPDLYWSFDDETIEDSTVHDVTTNDYNGTMNSGVTDGEEGIVGEAVVFDGATGIINGDLPKTNTFTVSVWINPASFPTAGDVREVAVNLGNGPGSWEGWLVSVRYTETISFGVEGGGGVSNEKRVITQNNVPTGEWTHIAGTMNSGEEEIRIYCNGVFQESVSLGFSAINFGTNGLVLGRHSFFENYYFDGVLDEFAIFNDKVLSDDDIESLYEVGKAGQPIVFL
jgi:hypothetical protein